MLKYKMFSFFFLWNASNSYIGAKGYLSELMEK